MRHGILKRVTFAALAFLFSAITFITALPPAQAAAASGEVFTWTSNTEMSVTGGILAAGTQKLTGAAAGLSVGGTLQHSSGCNFKVSIILQPGGTSGNLIFPQSTGGTPLPNQCPADRIQSILGAVTITNSRPAPGDTPETAAMRTAVIRLNSPDPYGESTDDVEFTLTYPDGHTVKRTVNKQNDEVNDGTPIDGQSAFYVTTFTDLDPGNYKICFDAITDQCTNFTKVKYKQISFSVGEDLGQRSLKVIVELHWSGPAEARTVGPAVLILKQNGVEKQSVTTDSQQYIPTPAEEQAGGLITIDFTFKLNGSFANLSPGKYQVCVSGTSVCKDYQKVAGATDTITIVLHGEDAANIILGGTDDEEKPVCEASSSALSWLLCPIFNGLADFSDWMLLNIIVPFLRPSPVGLNPDDKATGAVYQIWSTMRVYADIILVLLLIVAVVSQAYNGGIVQAYTAKKMLPRILIAAVLINTSIYIVAFAIDMSNLIGSSIADIITSPLVQTGQFKFNPTNTQAFAVTGIAVFLGAAVTFLVTNGFLMSILPLLLVFVVLPVFLALVGVFITLILLQAAYMALTIFSSIAFALWCLPNTEKYFHTWWDWLFRALLTYPIFMTILGISDVFTVLIQKANGG